MSSIVSRVWNSPTFMTWGSFLSRSISLVVVLPLLLTRLHPAEITIWYLFMSLIGLQAVVDAGFSPTFSRIISYVMGGGHLENLKSPSGTVSRTIEIKDLNRVYSTMGTIYFRLGLAWTLLLLVAGTLALKKPIAAVHDATAAWLAWGVIVAVSSLSFQGEFYGSYLQGINCIALLRRWEIATSLGGLAAAFLVLFFGGGLLALVVANQSWQIITLIGKRWLAHSIDNGLARTFTTEPFSRDVFDSVWPSAWRSGVGVLMSYGLIQASGVMYAQTGDTVSVASYLLGLRFIQIVSQFSQAPFYSKVPALARLYAEGKREELVRMAQRGMRLSHWTYLLGFASVGLIVGPFLRYIGSNVAFPASLLWAMLGLAFFVERFGAMHLQLYSTTNHIIWHIANGVTGVIYLAVCFGLHSYIGVYAIPAGVIAGYLGFYSWFSVKHSYKAFNLNFLDFEISCSLAPVMLLILSSLLMLSLGH